MKSEDTRIVMLTFGCVLKALVDFEDVPLDQVITDAAIDSRLIIPGAIFIALPGERTDGHDYVADAFQRGAVLALVERDMPKNLSVLDLRQPLSRADLEDIRFPFCLRVANSLDALQKIAQYWRTQLSIRVIGITGSVGKSTTKELSAEVLGQRYRTFKNPGNYNNEIGLPLSMLRLTEAHQRGVLEMGFYVPGEIALLCRIARPHVGVLTNISEVHLERAGSIDAIVTGKRELIESLPSAPEGVAILNYDDLRVRQMADCTQARIFYYGLSPESDLWASGIEGLGLEGVRFVLHYQGDRTYVKVPLLGRHSVHTALRATAIGLVEGLSWGEIIGGLQSGHAQLRLVAVHGPGGSLLLDDTYNAAPPSVIADLNLLAELDGRRIAVLGDMLELGSFEERGHRMVGSRAAAVVDSLIVVGARARWIADEASKAGMSEKNIAAFEDRKEAIKYLSNRIGEGDVVLIKGSHSMRMDEIVSALEEGE